MSHSHDKANDRRHFLGKTSALALGTFASLLGAGNVVAQEKPALERVRERGRLSVALYNDLPPFHVKGQGIEIEMAKALAKSLGVEVSLLPFPADDNMNDDLRNMVWKGHYLGYGPADVMLHVPVDRPLMQDNPRVSIFGPYWRERVVVARDLSKLPVLDSLEPLRLQTTAVPGLSLAGWLMIGADSGALRERLITKIPDRCRGGADAAAWRSGRRRRTAIGNRDRAARRPALRDRADPDAARARTAGRWHGPSRRTPPTWPRRCKGR